MLKAGRKALCALSCLAVDMKKIILILFAIVANMVIFSYMTELLRQPDDTAVLGGVILACIFIVGNFFVIKHVLKN